MQFSNSLRSAIVDVIESHIGASAILKVFSGTKPASVSDADAGTKLFEIECPADWMAAASAGVKQKAGTWEVEGADADGTASYFRVYSSDGTTCHMQGSCTLMAGAGPMKLSTLTIVTGMPVTVTMFTLTAGNQ